MTLSSRLKWLVIAGLVVVTLGLNSAYKAYAKGAFGTSSRDSAQSSDVGLRDASGKPNKAVSSRAIEVHGRGVTIRAELDRGAVLRHRDDTVHVEVTLNTPPGLDGRSRTATDIVVVLDRSGSMRGDKFYFAQQALRELIGRLGDDDRFGLVAYSSDAQTLVPLSYATSYARQSWLSIVDRLEVQSSTNMSAGLDLGLGLIERARTAHRARRMLLLSDGLANTGDASFSGLMRRAQRAVRGDTVLSTMGIGADFDERLMASLASAGTGAFYYLAKLEVLPEFFDAELRTASQTYASSVSLVFRPGPGVRLVRVMGLPFQYEGRDVIVPLGSLYTGHERRIWLTLTVSSDRVSELGIGELSARFRSGEGYHSLPAGSLPPVQCVDDWNVFRSQIHAPVWERAIVNEELNRAQENLGDAISRGTPADVDRELADARRHSALARSLGSQKVLDSLSKLENSGRLAKKAQAAPAPARSMEAKRQKADGYIQRNHGSYVNADAKAGY
ncbi:MAG: VWA domain-containing protein [Polyangiaceae bacterium]|nr:VWA domain-containing protein [Polyangiaceae bacterium]